MTKTELTEKNWNGHFAFMHLNELKNAKEVYLNGKPLKWWKRFKNGDIVEIIDRPNGIIATFLSVVFAAVSTFVVANPAIILGVVGLVGLAGAAAITSGSLNRNPNSTTQNKEYSSTTQPELRGASNDISNDIIPVTFGRTQQTPSYAQTPYRLVQDGSSTNKYRQYFISNYNNVVYSDFKLGETSVDDYSIDYLNIEQASGSNNFIGLRTAKPFR